MAITNDEVQAEQSAEQQTTEQSSAGLTLQDLISVAQIIQVTSQRGAYRAEELQSVGTLYNKLIAFLESVGAINRPQAEATQDEETPNA